MSGPYGPGCDDLIAQLDRAWARTAAALGIMLFLVGIFVGTVATMLAVAVWG